MGKHVRKAEENISRLNGEGLPEKSKRFFEEKSKFDQLWEEKVQTFFSAFTADGAVVTFFSLMNTSTKLHNFAIPARVMIYAMLVAFLFLAGSCAMSTYVQCATAKKLTVDRTMLETMYNVEAGLRGNPANPLYDPKAAVEAKKQAENLKETKIRLWPHLLIGIGVCLAILIVIASHVFILWHI